MVEEEDVEPGDISVTRFVRTKKHRTGASTVPVVELREKEAMAAAEGGEGRELLRKTGMKVAVAAEFGTPVWFEPASVTKSARVASIIDYITCASPNENELIAMANALSPEGKFTPIKKIVTAGQRPQPVQSLFENLKPAIQLLLSKGTKLLVVTLGSDGVLLCFRDAAGFMRNTMKNKEAIIYNKELHELVSKSCPSHHYASSLRSGLASLHSHIFHLPAAAASVVSVSGAGDCLVGGIIASLCSGLDIMQSTAVGIAAAKATVEVYSNVPTEFSLNRIASEAQHILSTTKHLVSD